MMRILPFLMKAGVFAGAGALSYGAAFVTTDALESRSIKAVQSALNTAGHDWVSLEADGLYVVIEGEAPDEVMRSRAMSIAGGVVDSSRVMDNMRVAESPINVQPDFALELLRNSEGISLIGLMPVESDRDGVLDTIADIAADTEVSDFLNTTNHDAPALWAKSLSFALDALELLPSSQISVQPGMVSIRAIANDEQERSKWERKLVRMQPSGLEVAFDISAPRPVITPFTIRFSQTPEQTGFDACSADNLAGMAQILSAAKQAGAEDASCQLGLGVPSQTWPEAVSQAIAAVDALGGGTLTFSDADVNLVALEGTDPSVFDRVVGDLENHLPPVFSLAAHLPVLPEASDEGPPEFSVVLSEDGTARISGRIADDLMNLTTKNYAMARFGHANVNMATRVLPDGLPSDWAERVLSGLEGLSHLHDGQALVTPDKITISGVTGEQEARAAISRLFIDKLGERAQFSINVTYDEALDPIASIPEPAECLEKIIAINERSKLLFDPGSANIAAASLDAINDISEVLKACQALPLQISGFTDSQGGEDMNKRLSERRARAVLNALRLRRVPTSSFAAVGFGEANPIADNETAEGREANRRIEFSLMANDEPTTHSAAPDADSDSEPTRNRTIPPARPATTLTEANENE